MPNIRERRCNTGIGQTLQAATLARLTGYAHDAGIYANATHEITSGLHGPRHIILDQYEPLCGQYQWPESHYEPLRVPCQWPKSHYEPLCGHYTAGHSWLWGHL